MTAKERKSLEEYVQAGRTLVRFEETWNGEHGEYFGIVMETYPSHIIDQDSNGHYQTDMLMVAWFDGTSNTFPLCCLDFWIEDQWLDADDVMMGEE